MECKKKQRKGTCVLGLMLLCFLVVCAYMGSSEVKVQTVSAAISRTKYDAVLANVNSVASAKGDLQKERENEIAMLYDVADRAGEDERLKKDALMQIAQLSARMEIEAEVTACLNEMGFDPVLVVTGNQGMTLICPLETMQDETERVRMIDAVQSVSGYDAGDIKIILAKK